MSLEDIAITVARADDFLTGNAEPVLKEITRLLETLDETGRGGSIDLASLPFSAADRRWLKDALGEGSITVNLDAGGPTTIAETATPGVWWIVHHNENNAQVGEFIEVTLVPELIPTHPDDVASGLRRLTDRLAAA